MAGITTNLKLVPAFSEQPQNFGFFGKLQSGLKQSDSNKVFGLMIGMAVVILFLGAVSLAPQVSKRFGQLSTKKQAQQSFAVTTQPPCGQFGDVDGDGSVSSADALAIQRYTSRLTTTVNFNDPAVLKRANVNGDLKVDSVDSLLIIRFISGLDYTFPVCVDHDGDGFVDGVESYIGTEPYKSCGTGAWPPDFDNSGKVTTIDLLPLKNALGAVQGAANYNRRADLNADGKIDTFDVVRFKPFFDTSCTFAPAPRISMQVLPANTVTVGQTVTITWTSTNTIAPCDAVGTAPGWAGQKPTANTAGIKISSSSPILYDNLRLTCYGPGGQTYVTASVKFNPPPCSGTPNWVFGINSKTDKVTVTQGDVVTASVSGLANCSGSDSIYINKLTGGVWDSGYLASCQLVSNSTCTATFTANLEPNNYTLRALLDKDTNGGPADSVSANQLILTVQAKKPLPHNMPSGWPATGNVGGAGVHTSCDSAGICDSRYSSWQAVDIGTSSGDYDVRSTMDGKVTKVETSNSCGGTVDIANETYIIHYCHLTNISVNVGDSVAFQQKIGQKSSSGYTGGYVHVHYAVSPGMTMDPPWVPFHPYSGNYINSLSDSNPGLGSSY